MDEPGASAAGEAEAASPSEGGDAGGDEGVDEGGDAGVDVARAVAEDAPPKSPEGRRVKASAAGAEVAAGATSVLQGLGSR